MELGKSFPAFGGKRAQGPVALVQNLKQLDFHISAEVSLNPALSVFTSLGEAQQALKWRVLPGTSRTERQMFSPRLLKTLWVGFISSCLSLKASQFLIVKCLAGWNGLPGKGERSVSLAVFKWHRDVIPGDRGWAGTLQGPLGAGGLC